ncbi:MAG: nucleotidyltransferase domain-containing protein [Deltaproteobacteria bacterium]|nr:nucleotidyltransferase domain-containing protein [Deltaproteobacteria bacterium]
MRLSQGEIEGIIKAFSSFAMKGCSLYLYGSRTDESLGGGDIDLHFEVPHHKLFHAKDQYLDFLVEMKENIGDQKIDLLISSPEIDDDDFLNQIRQKQILIKSW